MIINEEVDGEVDEENCHRVVEQTQHEYRMNPEYIKKIPIIFTLMAMLWIQIQIRWIQTFLATRIRIKLDPSLEREKHRSNYWENLTWFSDRRLFYVLHCNFISLVIILKGRILSKLSEIRSDWSWFQIRILFTCRMWEKSSRTCREGSSASSLKSINQSIIHSINTMIQYN